MKNSKLKIAIYIAAGLLAIFLLVSAYFYWFGKTDEKVITYNPLDNPEVQKLLQEHALDTARLNETIRQKTIQITGLMAYSLNALQSVSKNDILIARYYSQMTKFMNRIDSVKNEEELQTIINQLYKEIH